MAARLRIIELGTVLLLLLCLSHPAAAQRKTDVITLYNGDRITGEIKSLLGGRLELGTNAMGTIHIEWREIAAVSSAYNYELRLSDGQRFFGSLSPGEGPGTISIDDVFAPPSFDWREVVELRPVEDSLVERLDIYLSANYAYTKASGVTQTELRADLDYETENARNTLTSRATASDTDDRTTTSSRVALSRRVWTDRRALYRLIFGGYESNDELALDFRVTAGTGIGRYFIDTNNDTLNGSIALQVLEERSVEGDMQTSSEAVLSIDYARWRFVSPELDLRLNTSLYPSLTEWGRLRADGNARLRWEFIDNLYWDMSSWVSFDNEAIDDVAGEFDWGITTGLGWDF